MEYLNIYTLFENGFNMVDKRKGLGLPLIIGGILMNFLGFQGSLI